jgi:hypothetical protein
MGHYLSNRLFHRCGIYPLNVDHQADPSETDLFYPKGNLSPTEPTFWRVLRVFRSGAQVFGNDRRLSRTLDFSRDLIEGEISSITALTFNSADAVKRSV